MVEPGDYFIWNGPPADLYRVIGVYLGDEDQVDYVEVEHFAMAQKHGSVDSGHVVSFYMPLCMFESLVTQVLRPTKV